MYKETRATLVDRFTEAGLIPSGKKYKLVQRIVESRGEADEFVSKLTETDLYDGDTSSVPNTTAGLMKLSVAHLRAILRAHAVLEVGSKEELIARVGLLKGGLKEAAFSRERLCILHYIAVAKEISQHQVNNDSGHTVFRTRTFAHGKAKTVTTRNSCFQDLLRCNTPTIDKSSSKRSPLSILMTLEDILVKQEGKARAKVTEKSQSEPQKKSDNKISKEKKEESSNERLRRSERKRKQPAKLSDCGSSANFATHVGTIVDVLWTEKDLKGTNWEPGWYRGEVQKYDEDDDTLYLRNRKLSRVFL